MHQHAATTAQCISSLQAYITNNDPNGAGGIAQWANGMYPYGNTHGIFKASVAPQTCTSGYKSSVCNISQPLIAANGCYFTSGGSSPTYGSAGMRQDVAYIPAMDFYGNSTDGYMTNYPSISPTNDWVSSGPYTNLGLRVDSPEAVDHASFNAADNQARKIYTDSNYKPVIYVIGLGGASDMPDPLILQRFCKRVANDPASDSYNANGTTGMFVYSPDDAQLQAAFQTVASQILRLSK